MKRVKKIGSYYTLETPARAEETDLLCDQCGNLDCSIRLIVQRIKVNRFNARVSITRCESFVPILKFSDTAGLSGEFNTFRLGGAWAKRVSVGDVVLLQNGQGEAIDYATVCDTHIGSFSDMAHEYGVDNHLAINAEISGTPFDLAQVMTKLYGAHRFSLNSTVSVIELRRRDGVGEEGEADLRRVSGNA